MSDYVLTAKVGDNSDLFPDILKLYLPVGSFVLDMTWGNGVFWKNVNHVQMTGLMDREMKLKANYLVVGNDTDPERGMYHEDFRHTGWEPCTFDAVVLDPPYLYTGGFKTLKDSIDRGYNNKARAENGVYGVAAVDQMYNDGIVEAHRVLKPRGVLILKCQDQVMSGKQVWAHVVYAEMAIRAGFEQEDLFVLVQKNHPTMRHPPELQKHARRNHSYFLVLRKGKNG